jgi:hypothetical protein
VKEPVLYCQVAINCAGEKRPKYSGGKVKYKNYRAGEKIKGQAFNNSAIPTNYSPAFKTLDGYVINMGHLMVLGEEQIAEVIDDNKAFVEKIKDRYSLFNSGNSEGMIQGQTKRSKFMVNGAMIGGAGFFLYAMAKGGNKGTSAIFGIVIGALVGRMWANYRINN